MTESSSKNSTIPIENLVTTSLNFPNVIIVENDEHSKTERIRSSSAQEKVNSSQDPNFVKLSIVSKFPTENSSKKKNKNIKTFRDKIVELEKHIEDIDQQFQTIDQNIKKKIVEIDEITTKLSEEIKKITTNQKNLIGVVNNLATDIMMIRNKMTR